MVMKREMLIKFYFGPSCRFNKVGSFSLIHATELIFNIGKLVHIHKIVKLQSFTLKLIKTYVSILRIMYSGTELQINVRPDPMIILNESCPLDLCQFLSASTTTKHICG